MKKIISLFFILLISFYFSSNAQESLEGTYFKTAPSCFNSNFQLLTVYYHFNLITNPNNNNENTPTYRWNSVSTVRFFDTSNNQNGCTNTTSSNAPPSAMIEKYGTFHILNSQDSTQNNDGSTSTLYQIGLNTERQIITPLSSEFVDYLTDQNCGGLGSSASSNQPFFWKNGSPQDLSEGCLLIDNNSTTNPNRTSVGFDNIVFGNCKFVTVNAQLTNYTINNSDNTTSNNIVLFIPYINILNSENPNYQNDYDRLVCSENYSNLPALGANKTSPNTPTLTSVWTTPCDSNKNSTELFYFTDVDWNVERYYYSDSQCRHIHYITSTKGVYSLDLSTNSNRFLGYFNPKDQSILVVDRTQQQLSCISNSNDSLVPVDLGEQGCSDINLLPISECNQAFENILDIQENSLSVGLAPDLLCANNNQNDTSTSTSNSTYTRQNITKFVNEEIIDHSPWVSNCSSAWNYTRTLEFNEPNSFTETFVHYNDNNCSNQFIRVQRSGLFWFTGLSFLVPSTVDTIHQIYSQSITPLSPEGLDYLNNLTGCGNNQTNWELNVQRTFNNDEECARFELFSIDSCPYQYGLFSIKNAPHSETGNSTTPEGNENKILYTARRWDNSFNDCLGTGFRPQELSKQFLTATGDDDDDNVESSSSIINTIGDEDSAASRIFNISILGIFISVLFALVFLF